MVNKLYYPGDAFHEPGKAVEILGLPVAGPWLKISEAIDFAKKIKPKKAFPVHDGMMKDPKFMVAWPRQFLATEGIEVIDMPIGEPVEF